MRPRLVADDERGRAEAIEVLRGGGIVALPTDTVYGIAVALNAPGGIERLFAAKQRPPDKAIAVLLDDLDQVAGLVHVSDAARAMAECCWPGGLSLVLPMLPTAQLPAALTADTSALGVRLPDHPTPRALARALGPLPTTSANRSGEPEARDAAEIVFSLGDAIDLVIDGGPTRGGPPSTVVDCSSGPPRILRAGAISVERLAAVLADARISHRLGAAR